ncbi:hypothetical protein CAMGR0001_0114 [Campylobacter gracilis RM3268]|uniref:Uncharacterized protein n=1 Tax=Campylobacter gracilis RM3268 TaxID=553220 RepID=C8PID3_9BACT|nr:hypothetical protein CAMGR0001_0114 [Campylobacter gracilis RM3268]
MRRRKILKFCFKFMRYYAATATTKFRLKFRGAFKSWNL